MPDLDWTLSVPLRGSWAEVCRWITSLAGGSSCRGNVGWLDVAPSIQLSLRLKRHLKWCATAIRVVTTILSVSARRSVELDDDKVVSEYEEDWPEGGIGSAIRVSWPSYLGQSWQQSKSFSLCFKRKDLKIIPPTFFLDQSKIPFVEQCRYLQGRPQDLAGGEAKNFFFRFGNLHAMRFARGGLGHVPPRNFFKMVQFGAFWCIFWSDFVFK